MFEPYDTELIRLFCDCSNIYLFIDTNFPHSRNVTVSIPIDGRNGEYHEYNFKDPKTFYFQLPEDKLYGGRGYALVVFKHSEEEIINKFHKFMRLKAFL